MKTTNCGLPIFDGKKHIYNGQITDVFFLFYLLLLKIIAIAIIKVKAMIVTPTSAQNNI